MESKRKMLEDFLSKGEKTVYLQTKSLICDDIRQGTNFDTDLPQRGWGKRRGSKENYFHSKDN